MNEVYVLLAAIVIRAMCDERFSRRRMIQNLPYSAGLFLICWGATGFAWLTPQDSVVLAAFALFVLNIGKPERREPANAAKIKLHESDEAA